MSNYYSTFYKENKQIKSNMFLNNMIKQKTADQALLATTVSTYVDKYIRKIFSSIFPSSLQQFQQQLLYISEWDTQKQHKEFNKFLKWTSKRHKLDQNALQQKLDSILLLTTSILLYKHHAFSKIDGKSDIDLPKLSPQELFYKSMKKIAKFYYEDPKTIKDTYTSYDHSSLIIGIINAFIPLDNIIQIIEESDIPTESNHSYDFNRPSKKSSDKSSHRQLVIEKENDSQGTHTHDNQGLRYIPSDELYNEYYHSEPEQDAKHSNDGNNPNNRDEHSEKFEKHITIHKGKWKNVNNVNSK